MTTEELDLIEVSNKEAKEAVAKGDALKRLMENEDYKLIIMDGYMDEYPKLLGTAIAKNTGEYDTDKLVDILKSINSFVGYTFQVSSNYHAALQTLADNAEYVANSEKE